MTENFAREPEFVPGMDVKLCAAIGRARALILAQTPSVSVSVTRRSCADRRYEDTGLDQPAQQDNCVTSLAKVCAVSFNPSTIVR